MGRAIDQARPVRFSWAGRSFEGVHGDTLASALLANGIDVVGRSFKYHRPRGIIAAGLEEPNAIVQLEEGAATLANLKATQIALYEGLCAQPVNAWPTATFDLMAVTGLFKRFIPAAFYYKTFMWPNWSVFEGAIRAAAGLGRAPTAPDPDRYEHRFAHVDVLVVGSGAAGIAAALDAGRLGKSVMLVDHDAKLGGWTLSANEAVAQKGAADLAILAALPTVALMPRTMAFGYYDHNLVALCQRLTDQYPLHQRTGVRERLWKVRAQQVILATGAFERPLVFVGNDRPGVMLAGAALSYCRRYGVAVGRSIVLATNNDGAYESALALNDAGVRIAAIVDSRAPQAVGHALEARARGIDVITDSVPIAAKGRNRVRALTVAARAGNWRKTITCDTVLMSGGWNPAVHLHSQSGGSLAFDALASAFVPSNSYQAAKSQGWAAGEGLDTDPPGPVLTFGDGAASAQGAWLDFQNDVTVGDVHLAMRENFKSVEHVKRYTTLGMASDQGKTSNVNAISVMAGVLGTTPGEVGTTKFRPPFDPVTIGAFAGHRVGENLMPMARMAAHEAHVALGSAMEHYGRWWRSAFYHRGSEDEAAAVAREVLAVRRDVGLFEASPLGKIEVKGRDAAEFLDRIYVNPIKSLKVGKCRYGMMLNENGVIFDDGIVARMADDHFLVGTTSGRAAAVADMLEEWLQCEWIDLDVLTCNVTTNWAVMNIAGPQARAVLAAVGTDIALAPDSFGHMHYREGQVAGVRARIQRVSFTGELSYEIAVPWRYGTSLWEMLMEAGKPVGITAFGVEALMVMRIEKGFMHVGTDTEGTTEPQDIGMGPAIGKKQGDFVGRRSTMRPNSLASDRRQFVGIEVTDGGGPLACGAHIMPDRSKRPDRSEGYVTSSAFSPTLGRPVALALVAAGHQRLGQAIQIWNMGEWRSGRITLPNAYDPKGERLHG